MFFGFEAFGFIILEAIRVPEFGLGAEGFADGGFGDLLVGEAEGPGVLGAGFAGAGHSLPLLGQGGQVAARVVEQSAILGELLFVALNDVRRSFRNETFIA